MPVIPGTSPWPNSTAHSRHCRSQPITYRSQAFSLLLAHTSWPSSEAVAALQELWRRLRDLAGDLAQEAFPVRNRGGEIIGDGLAHVRQRIAHAQIHTGSTTRGIHDDRHVLSRMVRRRPAWIGIAPMVRGDHQHVGETQQRQELRKHAVKFFQRFCKSLHILPVAIQHVEIHQIAKNESALAFANRGCHFLHAVGVAVRRDVLFDSAAIVNVMNLANSENANFALRENIHQHRLRRIHGIIVPPRGPHEVSRRSRKRPRDHASHAVRPIQQFPCDFAHAVEFSDWDHLFMRGDLKHAVARRVHDWLARSYVLLAQFLDDLRAGSRLVSNRLPANLFLELFDQFLRESVFVNRERLLQPHSRHFPVSCRRIFPGRARRSLAIRSKRSTRRRLMFQRCDVRQSEPHQVRDFQRPRFRDVPERVSADVIIVRRIREFADSHAVQHNPENSLELPHIPASQVPFARTVPRCPARQFSPIIPVLHRSRPKLVLRTAEGARLFVLLASRRHFQFLPGSWLLYSGTNRSLNYFHSARVLPDSGGVPWPRTAIPGEVPSSFRSYSLRSALFFSSAIGIRVSIPCRFSGPTGRSFSFLSASEKTGITCKEAAIPTPLREFPSAPLLVRSRLSLSWSFFSGTDAAIPAVTASIPDRSTTRKPWICREQSRRTPGWKWVRDNSPSTAARVTFSTRILPTAIPSTSLAWITTWTAASANSTSPRIPTPFTSVVLKTIGFCISARTSLWS